MSCGPLNVNAGVSALFRAEDELLRTHRRTAGWAHSMLSCSKAYGTFC